MDNISSDHQMQIIKFLKFFRSKRDLSLDQIQADFDDTQDAQLNEEMYTREEVREERGCGWSVVSLADPRNAGREPVGWCFGECEAHS